MRMSRIARQQTLARRGTARLAAVFSGVLHLLVVTGLLGLASVWSPATHADVDEALEQFRLGEQAFGARQWSQAKAHYEAAVALHPGDGPLLANRRVTRTLLPGPGLRVSSLESGERQDYYPNRRLAEIRDRELDVKARARLAFKALNPPALRISHALLQHDGDHRLMAGESVRLVVDVHNDSATDADGVTLAVRSRALHLEETRHWDVIAGDSLVSGEWVLELPREMPGNALDLDLRAQERDGYSPGIVLASVPVLDWQQPSLVLVALDNGFVTAGQRGQQAYELRNVGDLPAREVRVQLLPGAGGARSEAGLSPGRGVPEIQVDGYDRPLDLGLLAPGAAVRLDATVLPMIRVEEGARLPLHWQVWSGGEVVLTEEVLLTATHQVAGDGVQMVAGAPVMTRAALGDVDLPEHLPTLTRAPRDYAVLIGNSRYRHLPANMNVAYALYDRRLMQRLAEQTLGVPTANIVGDTEDLTSGQMRLLLGEPGGEGKLHELIRASGGADTVYFYYSGHGMPDPRDADNAYLLPVDAAPSDAGRLGYSLHALYGQLARLQARRFVVMLEACFSGRSDSLVVRQGGLGLLPGTSALLLAPELPERPDERFLVYSASRGDELANWLSVNRHGLFTSFLVKGLAGEADDGDGRLTSGELRDFVQARVAATALRYPQARRQNPQLLGSPDEVLVDFAMEDMGRSASAEREKGR